MHTTGTRRDHTSSLWCLTLPLQCCRAGSCHCLVACVINLRSFDCLYVHLSLSGRMQLGSTNRAHPGAMPRHGSPPSSQGSPPVSDDGQSPDVEGPLTADEEAQLVALLRRKLGVGRRQQTASSGTAPHAADGLTSAATSATAGAPPPTTSDDATNNTTAGGGTARTGGTTIDGDVRHYAVWNIPGADDVFGVFTGKYPEVWMEICRHLRGGKFPGSGARLHRMHTLLDAITLYREEHARYFRHMPWLPADPPIHRF